MVLPGETIQYLITGTLGVGTMRLEYTTNHQKWEFAQIATGNAVFTGTVAVPIESETIGWIKNETGKKCVYRWRCTTATSGTFSCTLTKQIAIAARIDSSVVVLVDNDAPVNGADGDGASFAGTGSIYIDKSAGMIYRNDGTAAMVNWVSM